MFRSRLEAVPLNVTNGGESPRFSVAMCTYNGEKHLAKQLESIAAQRLLPVELVLCDDGSSDSTLQIAEAFARRVPFETRIFRNPANLGYSRNFAQAIRLCSADLIALCDQDDVWYPSKLLRLADLFEDETVGGVFSNGDLIDSNSKPQSGDLWSSFSFKQSDQRRFRSGQALEVLLQRNVVTGMAFAFRSACRNRLGGMPPSWPHDAWLALMLAVDGRLVACPERLVAYRVHANQQIGVPITTSDKLRYIAGHGIGGYIQLSRDRNIKDYEQAACMFEDLLSSAGDEAPTPAHQTLMLMARAKVDHADRAVERLSLGRLRRWPRVLGQTKNYSRYSPTGLKAMVRDLFL